MRSLHRAAPGVLTIAVASLAVVRPSASSPAHPRDLEGIWKEQR